MVVDVVEVSIVVGSSVLVTFSVVVGFLVHDFLQCFIARTVAQLANSHQCGSAEQTTGQFSIALCVLQSTASHHSGSFKCIIIINFCRRRVARALLYCLLINNVRLFVMIGNEKHDFVPY